MAAVDETKYRIVEGRVDLAATLIISLSNSDNRSFAKALEMYICLGQNDSSPYKLKKKKRFAKKWTILSAFGSKFSFFLY